MENVTKENMTKDGNEACMLPRAVMLGREDKVKAILKRNTPDCVLLQNEEGATPAHIAARNAVRYGKWAILVMLLEKNMDCATIQDKGGETVLHILAEAWNWNVQEPDVLMETMEMILENKPESTLLPNERGDLPKDCCDNPEARDMLVKTGLQAKILQLEASLLAAEERLQALGETLHGTKPASMKQKHPALIPTPPGMKGTP